MKVKDLEYILLRSASNLMKKEGQKTLEQGLLTDLKGKKLEKHYHIYGRVSNENRSKEFYTHIKINLERNKLESATCNCDDYRELSVEGNVFMCSHLTATAYKFLSAQIKNKPEDTTVEEERNKKESIVNAKLIRITSSPTEHYEYRVPKQNTVKLKPDELRNVLESIPNRKISFKYDYLEFVAPIHHKNLPLSFTLKERKGLLVLTTHKQLPLSLNPKKDVFLFKNEIFLPLKEQSDIFVPLLEKFKSKREIIYPSDIHNYNKLLASLSKISSEINVAEELKNQMSNFLKPILLLYKEKNNIYCQVQIDYGNIKINILKENKQADNVFRDWSKEEKIKMELEKYSFIKKNERFMFIGDDEALFQLISKKKNSINSIGKVIFHSSLSEIKLYSSEDVEAELKLQDGYYDLSYNIKDIKYEELNSIITAYRNKNKFYKTKNNNFLDFEDEGIKNFLDMLQVLNIEEAEKEGNVAVEQSKALYLMENMKNHKFGFIKGEEELRILENKLSHINNKIIVLPKDLKAVLRDYQISGYRWFKNMSELGFGGILADEMGLGKTIQTIAFILSEENKKTIVITPTSLIYNWKAEFEKFAPTLRVAIIYGDKAERLKRLQELEQYDVILTSYGTLRMDIALYDNINFDFCIIDEGQNIKNYLAKNTKVIKKVKAKSKFALTGTPIENNLMELWSIFDFVMPGYLYSKESFEYKFILGNEENLENLKLLIKPFILRRTKSQVIKELPDKIEKKFLVQMTAPQKTIYNAFAKQVRDKMLKGMDEKLQVFSYLTKLRQICLDPSLIIDEYAGGSGKLKIALDIIKEHINSKGKVILFSQFTSALSKIEKSLELEKINYLYLDGSVKPKERLRRVDEFNSNEEIRVFLISLKAGGTGLNLTSANLVIHFDPWWNPAVENQATDRAHRIGQKNIVEVVKLIAKGTIEEKIVLLQEDKKNLIENVITGELKNSNLISRLTKEEILQLFDRE